MGSERLTDFSYDLIEICEEALHVAKFLMECALAVKDFEFVGIAEVMRKKAQEGIDAADDARRHEEQRSHEDKAVRQE